MMVQRTFFQIRQFSVHDQTFDCETRKTKSSQFYFSLAILFVFAKNCFLKLFPVHFFVSLSSLNEIFFNMDEEAKTSWTQSQPVRDPFSFSGQFIV